MSEEDRIFKLLQRAKKLAQEYRRLTGKPLGITGEVAEYEAAKLLGVKLTPARQEGYDATEQRNGRDWKIQIKGRCVRAHGKQTQMLGSIRVTKEFDSVLMVLLDENLDAVAIYEAERETILNALAVPGSKSRNDRGVLSVSKFKSISRLRWSNTTTR